MQTDLIGDALDDSYRCVAQEGTDLQERELESDSDETLPFPAAHMIIVIFIDLETLAYK